MTTPPDATHFSDFYGIKTFYKIALGILSYGKLLYYGVESGRPFYGWWYWDGKEWRPDLATRASVLRPIAQS